MAGLSHIISGFISFGILHIKTNKFEPWQWLMLIFGLITLIVAAVFWFLFPDSPTTAWFLTKEERMIAVQRIKVNQTGVENKYFRREQMIEALLDPKTWLFALFAAFENIPNSLSNQRSIIVNSFGFTTLQTTLLGCVDGVIAIVSIWSGVVIATRIPNSRAYVACAYFIPDILGVFLLNFLPWDNKNRIRDQEPADDTYDAVYIERTVDGFLEKVKVDKVRNLLTLLWTTIKH
ncbi:hypothetical protein C0995_000344 [Termitomyces sp. Mi166|nr:hypothetical protein C0995_000344 [Termitomyces sp. Mi166\